MNLKNTSLRQLMILPVLLCGASAWAHCGTKNMDQFEVAIAKVSSWRQLNDIYKTYSAECSSSESLPDVVEKLFTSEWSKLSEFAQLAKAQPKFKRFVLESIDATMNDPKAIEQLATHKCPAKLNKLCAEIKMAARKAASED